VNTPLKLPVSTGAVVDEQLLGVAATGVVDPQVEFAVAIDVAGHWVL